MSDLMLQDPKLKQKLEEDYPWTGIYKLYCKTDDMKSVLPVQRILKEDTAGVLYIGTSDYLPNRIEDLKMSLIEAMNPEQLQSRLHKHTCGKKYVNKELQIKFPLERLWVQIIPSNKEGNVDSHYILENQAIFDYEGEFGEPPPLNEGRKS